MHVKDARKRFEELLAARRLALDTLAPSAALEALLDFYVNEPAEDARGQGDPGDLADVVFFEWGTYDWGDGPSFNYGVRRQFFIDGTDPDDADEGIWALELAFSYRPSPETADLGEGGEMCSDPGDVERFRALVQAHPATLYAERARPRSVELKFEQPG